MKATDRSIVGILLMVFVFFVVLMIFAYYTMSSLRDKGEFGGELAATGNSIIAVVEVNGVIMNAKDTVELLHRAEKETKVKAIIIRVNSPGGAVGPSQEIYQEIRRIDAEYETSKGSKGKPVYASFGTVAASGGYYIGSAARKIYSNPGTLTGSIGVIMKFVNLSKLFELAKVKTNNITAGRYKDIGDPAKEMTGEERQVLEEMINGVHSQFINHILATRKKRIKGDIRELAQGQIFSGEQALKFGLVDKLGGLWEASRDIQKELGLKDTPQLKYVKKKKPSGIWKIIDNMEEVSSGIAKILSVLDINNTGSSPTPSLHYQIK